MGGSVKFMKGYETSASTCANTPYSINNCKRGSGTPNLNGTTAKYAPLLYLPDNTSQFSTFPGCQYTGDTRIKFNSNGTMTVWSKDSAGKSTGTNCGTFTAGNSYTQVVNVPTDQVIYDSAGSAVHQCLSGEIGDGRDIRSAYGGPLTPKPVGRNPSTPAAIRWSHPSPPAGTPQ